MDPKYTKGFPRSCLSNNVFPYPQWTKQVCNNFSPRFSKCIHIALDARMNLTLFVDKVWAFNTSTPMELPVKYSPTNLLYSTFGFIFQLDWFSSERQLNLPVTSDVHDFPDFSDYVFFVDPFSNTNGLTVLDGGQNMMVPILYGGLYRGAYPAVVQVFRGPQKYDYDPIDINFESVCDGDIYTTVTVQLTVSYVRSCAMAEFFSKFRTFQVTADAFVNIFVFTCFPNDKMLIFSDRIPP